MTSLHECSDSCSHLCRICGSAGPFTAGSLRGRNIVCRPCCRRQWAKHIESKAARLGMSVPQLEQARSRAKYYRYRMAVLDHYGGKCACCRESNYAFLSLDHIGGGGKAHRARFGNSHGIYRDLARQGFPTGFQILCHNCNQAKSSWGICPHATGRDVELEMRKAMKLVA